jgi:hypothetical protein
MFDFPAVVGNQGLACLLIYFGHNAYNNTLDNEVFTIAINDKRCFFKGGCRKGFHNQPVEKTESRYKKEVIGNSVG